MQPPDVAVPVPSTPDSGGVPPPNRDAGAKPKIPVGYLAYLTAKEHTRQRELELATERERTRQKEIDEAMLKYRCDADVQVSEERTRRHPIG